MADFYVPTVFFVFVEEPNANGKSYGVGSTRYQNCVNMLNKIT